MASSDVILPAFAKPLKYSLLLKPDLEKFTFDGVTTIELEILEPSKYIKLHASELQFKQVHLQNEGLDLSISGSDVSLDKDAETATIPLGDKELKKGKAVLKIEYSGIHNANMVGFYRSAYSVNGQKKYMVTTQFEATDARKAFPCWDEPARKATFDVTLLVPSDLAALSNMPVVDEKSNSDGTKTVHFAESPIMSTYLLAFIVGELESFTGKTAEGVDVRVFTTPGKRSQGLFALDVASKILSFFSSYFGIEYPLPKADLVAIPDFAAGAMENWGLVTFRETALLIDENSAATQRQRVAYVVAHELAHQWFGNLVTMKWWNDLWLNEGFATWVGWLGVDHCFPDWHVWTQFTSNEMSRALATDALLSSHPIEVPIKDPKEIQQVFDALSYQKGACVIRMLEAMLGHDQFQKGLQQYLARHKYSNTETADLWASLAEASCKPVQEVMDTWTKQMGYPLVSLTESEGKVKLKQTRFLAAGLREGDEKWWVPIKGVSDGKEVPQVLLKDKESADSGIEMPPSGQWLKLNPGQTGIYRVNYTPSLWNELAKAVASLSLPPVDRLGVMSDAFALAKAGVLPTSQALELAMAFVNETEYTVWNQLSTDLGELDSILSNTDLYPMMEIVGRKLYSKIADTIGWEAKQGESHLVGMLRPLVLGSLSKAGHKPTIEECRKRFNAMTRDLQSVHPDLRGLVMTSAVRNGGREEFEAAIELYRKAQSADMKIKCLTAVGQAKDPKLVQEFLEFGANEEEVRAQDVLYVFAALAQNRHGRDISWQYVKEHWNQIYDRFKNVHGLIQYVACLPIRAFASEEKAVEAEQFFQAHPVPEAKMELARTLESIRSKAQWLARDKEGIATWLKKASSDPPASTL